MSMKVEGTKHFDAPQAKVWEVLNDPSRMAKTMPGVKDFSIEDDRHWTAKVVIPLGLGGLKMSINFEKVEERAPDYARLNAKGTGVGAMLNMDTQFELSESGGGTEMKWEADVRLMGQVGSMGQRVLQPIVNQQVQNVLGAWTPRSVRPPAIPVAGPSARRRPEARSKVSIRARPRRTLRSLPAPLVRLRNRVSG